MIWSAVGLLPGGLFKSLNIWNSGGFVFVAGAFAYLLKRVAGAIVGLSVREVLGRKEKTDDQGKGTTTDSDDEPDPDLGDPEQFRRLTDEDFENKPKNPQNCWLRPFNLTEIQAGYAVERQKTTGDRPSVVRELVSELKTGDNRVVVGTPGAGKTTICNYVAYRWHEDEDTGGVLYREKRRGSGVDLRRLKEKIESAKGGADDEDGAKGEENHVLVVVEDAARSDAISVLEAAYDYVADFNVSFLLDSRETEWRDFDEIVGGHQQIDTSAGHWQQVLSERNNFVGKYPVPDLDETEVGRIADRYADVTGRTVHRSKERLYEQIQSEEGASPLLLLAYHLHVGPADGDDDGELSALEKNVRDVFDDIESGDGFSTDRASDSDLLVEVGLLVNILNAAGIGVHVDLLHALADDERDHRKIDEFIDELDGKLLFGKAEGTRYWCHHELWSELYLARHWEEAGSKRDARETFEECVNGLFSVIDEEPNRYVRGAKAAFNRLPVPREVETRTVRERIRDNAEGETSKIDEIDRNSGEYADQYVDDVFELGVKNLRIAPLFETIEESEIDFPGSCSKVTVANCYLKRGRMLRDLGDYDAGKTELKRALKVGNESRNAIHYERAYYHTMGTFARKRGDYYAARAYHECALAIHRDLENLAGVAKSLNSLGIIARRESDYETARDYYERSLAIKRDIDDRAGEASTLNNLGTVARQQSDYEAARDYHECALIIYRNLDARSGEAKSLNNLGEVERLKDNYEAAQDYYERSLDIHRDLGDLAGVAGTLNNLGIVAHHHNDHEAALDYYERSLEIKRNLNDKAGEATTLTNLGGVAHDQNDYDTALDYYECSLDIHRDLNDRAGGASTLNNIGAVAYDRENFDTAKEHFEDAADILRDIGAIKELLKTHHNLARVCNQQNDLENAVKWCKTALSTIDQADISGLDNERDTFEVLYDQLKAPEQPLKDTYFDALENVLKNQARTALQLFRHTWENRDGASEDQHSTALTAGVGFAAHTRFFDDEQADEDRQEVLDEIAQHEDRLAQPELALYEYLTEGETDTTPEELRDEVDGEGEELDVHDMEYKAYASLLEALQEQDEEQ